ncbi:hypothetical protein KMW28_27240 [Flammeovirga yaeyamensis]|uniref:Uncharacterized protein n=2 Tax=Flammeovirga yaeyamensis TaxID=367791 RepID=A0AAX1NCC0_9BACT|nr:hypothetical protein [Flammeovirga yaeyamensis]MBB3700023.1 hypothetical protein [Flammeovirga yaeyamensis]QWG04596.1 hypothetical protein KMW28_27240 [Flammeovirga yaeyamensis]
MDKPTSGWTKVAAMNPGLPITVPTVDTVAATADVFVAFLGSFAVLKMRLTPSQIVLNRSFIVL